MSEHPNDDPIEDILPARARVARASTPSWSNLRAGDPTFAEASALSPEDISEWQAAVYLLTGCDEVWRAVAAAVARGPLDRTRRA
jgi:hypothetical protein